MKKLGKSILLGVLIACITLLCGCSGGAKLKNVSKNLSMYKIDAVLDEEKMKISATEEICYVNNTNVDLAFVCFNFYPPAFSENSEIKPYTQKNFAKVFPNGEDFGNGIIDCVKVNGKEKEFAFEEGSVTAFKIEFDDVLKPKQKTNIEIEFEVELANCTHRLGYCNGSVALGNFFPIVAVYERGDFVTYPYYSTGDPFYSDLANFEVSIAVDEKYDLVSTGVVEAVENAENMKNYTISALAVRDFAVSLLKDAKTVEKTVKKTQISYTGYKNDVDFEQNLQTAVLAFEFFEETFGDYPYETLSIVKMPFVHGGMEYPNMVVISDSIAGEFEVAKVIVHEIAHQWWYGMVGNNQITEAWLDESLAEYSSVLFFDAHKEYGATYEELVQDAFSTYTLFVDIAETSTGSVKTSMLLPIFEYASEYEYSYMIYTKGILMFDAIGDIIGHKKLIDCFKQYFNQYRFKTAKTDDLIVSFKKTSKKDIEGVFDSWLGGNVVIGVI